MKERLLFLLGLIIAMALACRVEPMEQSFPVLETLPVTNIDAIGATFQAELLIDGATSARTRYGFVWDVSEPTLRNSDFAIVGEDIDQGSFSLHMDSALARGAEYFVRAFAVYGNDTVYANVVSFISEGSARGGWSLEKAKIELEGWSDSFGCANDNFGYIIFQSGHTYKLNPESVEIQPIQDFPIVEFSFTNATGVGAGDELYVATDQNRLHSLNDDKWTLKSSLPFYYNNFYGYIHGYIVGPNLLFLSSYQAYAHEIPSGNWYNRTMLNLSQGNSKGGISLGNKAYIITSYKEIWEYNSENDSWAYKTTYPGVLYEKIISFAYDGKVYFGCSYKDYDNGTDWMDRQFWAYDPVSDEWNAATKFPTEFQQGEFFFFYLKEHLYIGHTPTFGDYSIWKFNPSVTGNM